MNATFRSFSVRRTATAILVVAVLVLFGALFRHNPQVARFCGRKTLPFKVALFAVRRALRPSPTLGATSAS